MVAHRMLALVLTLGACGAPEAWRTSAFSTSGDVADQTPTKPGSADQGQGESTFDTGAWESLDIRPAEGIGPAQIGNLYKDFVALHGSPDSTTSYRRLILSTWFELGIEVVATSAMEDVPSEDAEIIAVGTKAFGGFSGLVVPGMSRWDVEAALGPSPDVVEQAHYYPAGLCVIYGGDDTVLMVSIFPAYTIRSTPPEMVPSRSWEG